MIGADEVREGPGQMEFSLTRMEGRGLQRNAVTTSPNQNVASSHVGISLSGSQLIGFTSVLCFVGLLSWALLKLWLFGQ